jgi:hypothetical protein
MEDRKKALTDMMSDDEKSGFYIDKFKKESKEIFDNEVKPQIDRAMKYRRTVSQLVIDKLCTLFSLKELGGIDEHEYFHRLKEVERDALRMEYEQFEKLKDFDTWKEWKNTVQ